MTSKEALKKLFFDNKDLHVDIVLNDRNVCEIYNTIKQDLERLKVLEEENQDLKNRLDNEQLAFDKLFESNQKLSELYAKLKQALDILKDKKVSIGLLLKNNTLNQYNRVRHLYDADFLIQEEYELLKEILEDES